MDFFSTTFLGGYLQSVFLSCVHFLNQRKSYFHVQLLKLEKYFHLALTDVFLSHFNQQLLKCILVVFASINFVAYL